MLHPAAYFASKMLAQYPLALQQEQIFVKGKKDFGDLWPSWCGLPMAAVYAIITQGATTSNAPHVIAPKIEDLSKLTAALIWNHAKVIYKFDSTLALELTSQSLEPEDIIPMEIFYQLPHFCQYIEAPLIIANEPQLGFFVWMEIDSNTKVPELRLLFLNSKNETKSIPIIFTSERTLASSLDALTHSAISRLHIAKEANIKIPDNLTEVFPQEMLAALQLVLYLCSDDPDIPESPSIARISSSRSSNEHRIKGSLPISTINVGYRIGAALNRHYAHSSDHIASGEEPKYHVQPHIRRAHWHSFWTGPLQGERKLILKWLSPILVGAQREDDIIDTPVLYKIHKH